MSNEARGPFPWRNLLGWTLVGSAVAAFLLQPDALPAGFLSCFILFFLGVLALLGLPRRQGHLLGPHFSYDLLRLGRRGRTIGVRVVYLLALLVAFWWVYGRWLGQYLYLSEQLDILREADLPRSPPRGFDPNLQSRFAEAFAYGILLVQNLAVFLLTPAYMAGAIAEEREKKTLDLLLTTHLTEREIVLGKLAARLVHLVILLLAGLPVLFFMQFFGGVDAAVIAGNFYLTFMHLVALGSLSLFVSAQATSTLGAVLTTYFVAAPLLTCLGAIPSGLFPLGFLPGHAPGSDYYQALLRVMLTATAMEGIAALIFLVLAIGNVRGEGWEGRLAGIRPEEMNPERPPRGVALSVVEIRSPRVAPSTPLWEETADQETYERETAPPIPWPVLRDQLEANHPKDLAGIPYVLAPVTDNALLWKERYQGGPPLVASPLFWAIAVLTGSPFLMMAMAAVVQSLESGHFWDFYQHGFGAIASFLHYLIAGLFCLGAAFRAAGSVARERQQQTLDSLLCLPVERRDILVAKLVGTLARGKGWMILGLSILILGTLSGIYSPPRACAFLLAAVVHLVFFTTLGLFISVTSRTVLAAYVKMAGCLAVFFLGSVFYSIVSPGADDAVRHFLLGLNPVDNWRVLDPSFPAARDLVEHGIRIDPTTPRGAAWFLMLLSMGILWTLTKKIFQREGASVEA